jgi:tetratricopeptide (TPR) repeat protein
VARLAVACVVVLVVAGCARHPPPVQLAAPPAPRVDIEALLRRGCFHCFEQALTAAEAAGDTDRAFEAAALLVLRARELGLPVEERLTTLRRLASAENGRNDLVEVLAAMPSDVLSGDRYNRPFMDNRAQTRQARQIVQAWGSGASAIPASGWFRAYITTAAACAIQPPIGETAGVEAKKALDQWPDVPAIRVVVGTCTNDAALLASVRAADADVVDVEYPLGRIASQGRVPDYDESLRHLQAAHEAFPESIAIVTALGNLRVQREEWTDALATFDDVIARAPLHRDALLGRVVSLSRLARHDEAIAAATGMIDLGEWLLGPAYYWRAFNELQLRRLDDAAMDRDRAKTLMSNAAVFLLSGLIEWGQKRLPPSEAEFQHALTLDFGQCDAALYMGAVRHDLRKEPEAVAAFKQAIQCYGLAITVRQKAIDEIRAGAGTEAAKARLIAGHERAIAEATSKRDEATRDLQQIGGTR